MAPEPILPEPEALRREVEERVARLLARVGPLTLLGYDANGIQQFVTRATPLPYMAGASDLIKRFDADVGGRSDCLFAAGGRGRLLVAGEPGSRAVTALMDALRLEFADTTGGEVLAVAAAPFERGDERGSMGLLAALLDVAKDAAPPPGNAHLGNPMADPCRVCHRRPVAEGCHWWFGRNEKLVACVHCDRIIRAGNWSADRRRERGKTLADLSLSNRIAVVSADGNQMGALFRSMDTLVDAVVASRAVSAIFGPALEATLTAQGIDDKQRVTPVVGGDDIRLFVGPERIFEIVDGLVSLLEATIDRCAPRLGFPPAVRARFARIGIGIGVVIGPQTHPASLAIEQAHGLEGSAKRLCATQGFRSALDFIHLRSGDELIGALKPARFPIGISRFGGGERPLTVAMARARALTAVPTSQRQIVLSAGDDEPTMLNLFRYQVARSKAWQGWYDAIGVDWADRRALDEAAPRGGLLEMARLIDLVRRSERGARDA